MLPKTSWSHENLVHGWSKDGVCPLWSLGRMCEWTFFSFCDIPIGQELWPWQAFPSACVPLSCVWNVSGLLYPHQGSHTAALGGSSLWQGHSPPLKNCSLCIHLVSKTSDIWLPAPSSSDTFPLPFPWRVCCRGSCTLQEADRHAPIQC